MNSLNNIHLGMCLFIYALPMKSADNPLILRLCTARHDDYINYNGCQEQIFGRAYLNTFVVKKSRANSSFKRSF